METYIAVPEEPTPFSIRLTSKGYIAPGLAMFVCKSVAGISRAID